MKPVNCLAITGLFICLGSTGQTIGAGRLIVGAEDSAIPQPSKAIPQGHKDAAAIALLTHHLQLVNSLVSVSLHAMGTIDIERGTKLSSGTVELFLSGPDSLRMDVNTPDSAYSLRLTRSSAAIQRNGQSVRQLPASEAATGLLPVLKITQDLLSNQEISVVDEGEVNDPDELRRVAVSIPIIPKTNGGNGESEVVDMYFDPATGLLTKTARSQAKFTSLHGSPDIVIDTYSSFTHVGPVLIPTKISESVNGQHLWTINLSNMTIANLQADTFSF